MRDPRLDRLAEVLVRYSTRVKKGDVVALQADPIAMPLIEALYEQVLRAGGHPMYFAFPSALKESLLALGTDEQIAWTNPVELYIMETVDVRIALWADVNTKALGRADSTKIAKAQGSRRPIMRAFMQREASGALRWCGTQFPTQASAQDAEMSLRDYCDFVFRAGLLHLPDPVAAWQAVFDRQERVREFLQARDTLRFNTPARDGHDGTDLTVNVDRSKSVWINCGGHENFPDGEVFCGPQGADGHVNYTFPAVYQGREVDGVRLVFKGGRVVDASARKNEDFHFKMLDQDAGARTMGEIAIGTNYSITDFSKNTLFDEKIGGTFHAAVGAGYPKSGSANESGLHWDMVCDLRRGGTIAADGEVFHRDGAFLFPGAPC
ncbi:MAG: aminopeptidase [Phycisphaerales bacterium]